MNKITPGNLLSGKVLLMTPHMDDEVLAVGGSLAGLHDKSRVYPVYVTDGTRSPIPISARSNFRDPQLEQIRMAEACQAMSVLGIPQKNIHFLGFQDSELRRQQKELTQLLAGLISTIQPDRILVPFRFDRHPDHLALNRATFQAIAQEQFLVNVYEYFVYNRYRLLPGGDIRASILPGLCLEVDIYKWSDLKKKAIQSYRSQTTNYFEWQTRPILLPQRVEELSGQSEIFLKYDPDLPGSTIFGGNKAWVSFVHTVEPCFKNGKEQLLNILRLG